MLGTFAMVLLSMTAYNWYQNFKLQKKVKAQLDYLYEQSKQMNFMAYPSATNYPIPVYANEWEVLTTGEPAIGFIEAFEQVKYLAKNASAYKIQLNQKENSAVGFIHIKHHPNKNPFKSQ